MSSLLALDTNAYRALDDGNEVLAAEISRASGVGMPITVIGEIYYAIYHGNRADQNARRLQQFLSVSRVQILDVTTGTAKLFGEIAAQLRQAGRPIQQNDMWIAALCKQYGYTLATADEGFQHILGLDIFSFSPK